MTLEERLRMLGLGAAGNDPLTKTYNSINNYQTRLSNIGYQTPAQEKKTPWWLKALQTIDKPRNAIATGIANATDGGDFSTGFGEGWRREKDTYGSDFVKKLTDNKIAQTILGFGADVALDPLTYASFGLGSLGKGIATRSAVAMGADAAIKSAGDTLLNQAGRAMSTAAKAHNVESAMYTGANTANDLVNGIHALSGTDGALDTFRQALTRENKYTQKFADFLNATPKAYADDATSSLLDKDGLANAVNSFIDQHGKEYGMEIASQFNKSHGVGVHIPFTNKGVDVISGETMRKAGAKVGDAMSKVPGLRTVQSGMGSTASKLFNKYSLPKTSKSIENYLRQTEIARTGSVDFANDEELQFMKKLFSKKELRQYLPNVEKLESIYKAGGEIPATEYINSLEDSPFKQLAMSHGKLNGNPLKNVNMQEYTAPVSKSIWGVMDGSEMDDFMKKNGGLTAQTKVPGANLNNFDKMPQLDVATELAHQELQGQGFKQSNMYREVFDMTDSATGGRAIVYHAPDFQMQGAYTNGVLHLSDFTENKGVRRILNKVIKHLNDDGNAVSTISTRVDKKGLTVMRKAFNSNNPNLPLAVQVGNLGADGLYDVAVDINKVPNISQVVSGAGKGSRWTTTPRFFGKTREEAIEAARAHGELTGNDVYIVQMDNIQAGHPGSRPSDIAEKVAQKTKADPTYRAPTKIVTPENSLGVYKINPKGTDISSILEDMTPSLEETLKEQVGDMGKSTRIFKQKQSELSMHAVKNYMKFKDGKTFVPKMRTSGSVEKYGTYEVWENGKKIDEIEIPKPLKEDAIDSSVSTGNAADNTTMDAVQTEAAKQASPETKIFNKTKTYDDPIDEKSASMVDGKTDEEIIQTIYKADDAGDEDLADAITRRFMELGNSKADYTKRHTERELARKEYSDTLAKYIYERHNKIELKASLPGAIKDVEDAKAALEAVAPGDKGIKQLQKNLKMAESHVASINKQIKTTEVSINHVIDARIAHNPTTTAEDIAKLKKQLSDEIKNGHGNFLKLQEKNAAILKPANDMGKELNELDISISKAEKLVSRLKKSGKDATSAEAELKSMRDKKVELKASHTEELAKAEGIIKSQHIPANREEMLIADHQGLVDTHTNAKKVYDDMLANDEKAREELTKINKDARSLESYWENQGSELSIRDRYINNIEGHIKTYKKDIFKMEQTGQKLNDMSGTFESNLESYKAKLAKYEKDLEKYKAVTPMNSKQAIERAKKDMERAAFDVDESNNAIDALKAEREAKNVTDKATEDAINQATAEPAFAEVDNGAEVATPASPEEQASLEKLQQYGFKDFNDFEESIGTQNDYSNFRDVYKEVMNLDANKMDAATKILETPELLYSNELTTHEQALRTVGALFMDKLRIAGMQERNISLIGDLLDDYVPHVMSWEKIAKDGQVWDGGMSAKHMANMNLNSLGRKYRTTIEEANAIMAAQGYGDNYFETNIAKAYMTRMVRHNKVVYDQRFLDRILGNLGVDVSGFDKEHLNEAYASVGMDIKGNPKQEKYIMVVPKASIGMFSVNRAGVSTLNAMIEFMDNSMKFSDTATKMTGVDAKLKEAYDAINSIKGELDRVVKDAPEAGAAIESMLGLEGGDIGSVLEHMKGIENINSADYGVLQQMAKAVAKIPKTVTKFRDTQGLKSTLENLANPLDGALTQIDEHTMSLLGAHVENLKAYLLPEEVYKYVNKTARGQYDEGMNLLTKSVDKFNQLWKVTVTSMIPSFHIRNFFGGMQQNAFEFGVKCLSPKFMKASVGIAAGKEGVVKLAGREYTYSELRQIMAETRVNTPFFKTEANDLSGIYKRQFEDSVSHSLAKRALPWNVGRDVGNFTEQQLRATNFMAWLDDGIDPLAAAERTKSVMFDYTELSDAERRVFKRIMPFYTFFRKNFAYQLENVLNRPGQYAMIQHGIDNAANANDYDMTNAPEWLTKSMALPLGKDAGGLDKFANLSMPASDAFGRSIKDLVTGLNPALIAPMELYTNQNFLNGAPITKYPGQTTEVAGINIPNEMLHVMQKVGVIRNGVSAMNSSSDDPAGMFTSGTSPLSPASAFGIIKGYDESKGELNAAYAQDRELGNIVQMLKDKGVDVPTIADTNKLGGVTVRQLAKARKYTSSR